MYCYVCKGKIVLFVNNYIFFVVFGDEKVCFFVGSIKIELFVLFDGFFFLNNDYEDR